jgi:pescadillo protein
VRRAAPAHLSLLHTTPTLVKKSRCRILEDSGFAAMGGTKTKKGTRGYAVDYITRNMALKKLQVSLADFRQLCILKGVFPRDPKKKVKGKDKTYYLTKDILFLSHEPVLQKIRAARAHAKKIVKARARRETTRLQQLISSTPKYTLDHLVRERFPTFEDALRDLDDGLCTIHLFATLGSGDRIEVERIQDCTRLVKEWQAWVGSQRCLQKAFLSIKGCYFQATVFGQTITWLQPYKFNIDSGNADVDFRVLSTFLEFYQTHLHFVLYRLFTSVGLRYPPSIDSKADCADSGLASLKLQRISAGEHVTADEDDTVSKQEQRSRSHLKKKLKTIEDNSANLTSAPAGQPEAMASHEQTFVSPAAKLLSNSRVFLSREVPKELFEFVLRCMGARVGWEGEFSPFSENDEGITIQIVDRDFQRKRYFGRDYVQPQWLIDSLNNGLLLPVLEYSPGCVLPAHLSPFVNDRAEGYIPERAAQLSLLRGEQAVLPGPVGAAQHQSDGDEEMANDEAELPFGSYGIHDDDGDAAVAKIFEDELKEETGKNSSSSTEAKKKKAPKRTSAAEAELERQKLMMPKKTRYL